VSRYTAIAATAARQTVSARGEVLMRVAFYLALLIIFSRLWEVMDAEGRLGSLGLGAAAFLWYLALTEWITLGTPVLYLAIEEEVRRGDIAYRIARPVSYLWIKISEGFGEMLVRLATLAVTGLCAAWLFAGALPADPRGLLLALPLGLLAATVLLLLQVAIGLSAFWLHEASPVFWILQKFQFVFGGLLLPLDIYPDWLRTICEATPFSALIYGVGRCALAFDPALAVWTALRIVGWGALTFLFVAWLFRRAVKNLEVHGG
jgi:ABC-2 type transport system permease protein